MRSTRHLAAGLTALVAGFLGAASAFAVENGALDGNNHPSVGYVFAQQSDPNTCSAELIAGCSATLVSPTVAVTSGGCADAFATGGGVFNITAVWINFNPDDPFDCASASRVDALYVHPGYDPGVVPSPFDIGVAVLSAPATVAPASLPAADSQGGHARGDLFDIVNWSGVTGGTIYDYRRRFSPASFMSGDAGFLKLKLTLNGGHICIGGTEGGGVFLPSSQDLAALIVNTGGGGCKIADYLRLDAPGVRDFLDDFLTLP